MRPVRAPLAVLLGVAVLLGGCRGGEASTELTAVFDDVRHLAPRHAVRVADVQVGSITSIELDGFRAEVRLRVDPEHRVPVGTTAAVRQSSLLGENFVELRYPEGVDAASAPALQDGDTITETTTVAELEDLARRATAVISAISAADVDAILEAAVEGIGGRGEEIGALLTRVADLSTTYAGRSQDVAAVLDDLAQLGEDLAAGRDDIADAIVEAERAAGTVVRQRDRTVTALDAVAEASAAGDELLLIPHAQRLTALLDDLRPITARLAGERDRLRALLVNLEGFTETLPAVAPGELLQVYGHIRSTSGFEQPIAELLAFLFALAEQGP